MHTRAQINALQQQLELQRMNQGLGLLIDC